MKIWINGKIVPEGKALLHVQNEEIKYGNGLFETIRIYKSKPFLLFQHINRMYKSAEKLDYTLSYPKEQLAESAIKTISSNKITEGVLRLYCTSSGLIWITVSTNIPKYNQLRKTGINAIISNIRRNETSPLVTLKSFNYLENLMEKRNAVSLGFQEAIFLNTQGRLAEGTSCNIFIVKNGKLITPAVTEGILPGITREVVIQLAKDFSTEERKVFIEELWEGDEAFLTNSLMEIIPLMSVDRKPIHNGKPGKITLILSEKYKKMINLYDAKNF